ncbi:MAG TPA: sodium-translocating pyrophosphatase [Anaerolineae bacterium]|nr:sodium-translocating pyrophosphatase [Anaerolineae bacterium]HQJ51654.1 sodium-translocating pyrophosphatase [Anaerolineae bacterium]
MGLWQSLGSYTVAGLPAIWWLVPASSLIALFYSFLLHRKVKQYEEGTPEMVSVARAIRGGAVAYLVRQYRVIALVVFAVFLLFVVLAWRGLISVLTPFSVLLGALLCAAGGIIGMGTATRASVRTAHAARGSLNRALRVAMEGGAVTGLAVVGLALLNASLAFLALYYLVPPHLYRGDQPLVEIANILVSGVSGASIVALAARVGGGIFTKAADVGADLVGKVEAGIPEDDPRNPAVIADSVGDNVGDVAGMGSDLYESYIGSLLATVALGVSATVARGASLTAQLQYVTMPLVLAAFGTVWSIACLGLVRVRDDDGIEQVIQAMDRGLGCATAGVAAIALPLAFALQLERPWQMWCAVLIGLAVGAIIGKTSGYYTSAAYHPTRNLAEQALSGTAPVIIEGMGVGMRSVAVPVVVVCIGIAASYYLAGGAGDMLGGLYGVGVAAVGMLSTLGFTMSTDAFGPIADNAGGIAEMAGLAPHVRHRTDALDAAGNTTAATGKGFAIGSAALTALLLLAAFLDQIHFELVHLCGVQAVSVLGRLIPIHEVRLIDLVTYYDISLFNPAVIVGLFVGNAAVFYFSAMTISAVGRTASQMVQEVRRQFRSIAGIMDRTARPDYARCVDIATLGAQKEMVKPALLAVVVPLVMGVLFGPAGIVGLLAGSLASGFALALMMANSGAAWDNAKKHIEAGAHEGKGGDAHRAAVVGDTVGDPFKDTSGPSINTLIKLMAVVGIVLAGLIASLGQAGLLGQLINGW